MRLPDTEYCKQIHVDIHLEIQSGTNGQQENSDFPSMYLITF